MIRKRCQWVSRLFERNKEHKKKLEKIIQPSMFDRNNCMTQWLISIFVRLLSSEDNQMRETKFPLSTTFNSLPDC